MCLKMRYTLLQRELNMNKYGQAQDLRAPIVTQTHVFRCILYIYIIHINYSRISDLYFIKECLGKKRAELGAHSKMIQGGMSNTGMSNTAAAADDDDDDDDYIPVLSPSRPSPPHIIWLGLRFDLEPEILHEFRRLVGTSARYVACFSHPTWDDLNSYSLMVGKKQRSHMVLNFGIY